MDAQTTKVLSNDKGFEHALKSDTQIILKDCQRNSEEK